MGPHCRLTFRAVFTLPSTQIQLPRLLMWHDQRSSKLDVWLAVMLQVECTKEVSSEGDSKSKESASVDEGSSEEESESEESVVEEDKTQVQDLVTLCGVQGMPRVMLDSIPNIAFTSSSQITPEHGHAEVQPPVICAAPSAQVCLACIRVATMPDTVVLSCLKHKAVRCIQSG